jgi:hypothetical protein
MKMKNIYLLILVLGVLVSACELPDNRDPKAATDVPVETIFTNVLRDGIALVDNMGQNTQINRFLCQYNSQVNYTDPSRYVFSNRQISDGYWNGTYLALMDAREVKMLLSETNGGSESYQRQLANKIAIVDIMEVLLYQNLIDLMGDIPYTEALGGFDNKTPTYDDAATVWGDLLARLGLNIATLNGGMDDGSWGAEDLVYGGDVMMWKKFAATLKLRMGMRLADVNPSAAQSELAMALTAGVFEAGESFQLPWIGVAPHVNTINNLFVVGGRNDYAPSMTIVDLMFDLNDPRMPEFFTKTDTSTEAGVEKLAYVGLEYGLVAAANYYKISHFSDKMFAADYPATVCSYDEVEFILAEAAARGFTTPLSAQEHYDAGIAVSFDFWEADAAELSAYMAQADVAYDAARWKELIGTQKWLALYNRGNEGYASFRTFDWPVLSPPEDLTYQDIPMRYPFPFNEPALNFESYTAASSAIGGDKVGTLLFWDATTSTDTPSPN